MLKRRGQYLGAISLISSVAWCIFGSRWGAYLPKAPVFFNDMFLFVAIIAFSLRLAFKNYSKSTSFYSSDLFLKAFTVYAYFQLIRADWSNPLITLRDFAPFFYISIGLLVAEFKRDFVEIESKIIMLLNIALTFHAAWFTVAMLFPNLILQLPVIPESPNLRVFSPRSDFDCAMVSVFVSLKLLLSEKKRFLRVAFQVTLPVIAILISGTRAGFLALIISLTLVIVRKSAKNYNRKRIFISVLILFCGLVFVAPNTNLGARLGFNQDNQILQAEAQGTLQARQKSWPAVINYVKDNGYVNLFFGVSFGTNFMLESGASYLLIGKDYLQENTTRSPHNFLLTIFARLGIVGLILFLFLLFRILHCIFLSKNQSLLINDYFRLICVTLITVSLFGVVLESPFGAIPYSIASSFLISKYKIK